jgi:hypothetical protein
MTTFGDFNLYEELEVAKEASPEEIKKAYKKLAMVFLYNFRNGIQTKTLKILVLQKSSKEFHMLILFFPTPRREHITISTEKSMRIISTSKNL